MKNMLKALVNFLDRKFPDKVTITLLEYNQLFETLSNYNQYLQALNRKVEALEALVKVPAEDVNAELRKDMQKVKDEVSKLHVVLGFSRGQAPLER